MQNEFLTLKIAMTFYKLTVIKISFSQLKKLMKLDIFDLKEFEC